MSNKTAYETRRTVTIINDQPDSQRVKIRSLHDPIFSRLWNIASKTLESFHTDIVHDALMLSKAKASDKFLWGYRVSGTSMIRVKQSTRSYMTAIIAGMSNPLESWHLIEVVKVPESGHAVGYVTWLNSKSVEHLERVVEELRNQEGADDDSQSEIGAAS